MFTLKCESSLNELIAGKGPERECVSFADFQQNGSIVQWFCIFTAVFIVGYILYKAVRYWLNRPRVTMEVVPDAPSASQHTNGAGKLRPDTFDQFIGQSKAKFLLENAVQSAIKQNKPLEHILLVGNPGCGKTTLSWILAKERHCKIINATANSIENGVHISELFAKLEPNDILFIDEIHRLKPELAEFLYQPMEDNLGSFVFANGERHFCTTHPFTLIGATAYEQGRLPKPFLDRFGLKINLEPYTSHDMEEITRRSCGVIGLKFSEDLIKEVSKRSRFTPRIVNANLRRIQDYLVAKDITEVMMDHIVLILDSSGYDGFGLGPIDRKILETLANSQDGRAGVKAIAANSGVDMVSLEACYEPYLLQMGYLARTLRGREITSKGRQYLEGLKA